MHVDILSISGKYSIKHHFEKLNEMTIIFSVPSGLAFVSLKRLHFFSVHKIFHFILGIAR